MKFCDFFPVFLLKQGKLCKVRSEFEKTTDAKQNSMVISCKEIIKTKIFV